MARGLNYISGLEYTPASLGFLLRERQWRMGEIQKLRKRIAAESGRIARLQRVLADRDGARSVRRGTASTPSVAAPWWNGKENRKSGRREARQ